MCRKAKPNTGLQRHTQSWNHKYVHWHTHTVDHKEMLSDKTSSESSWQDIEGVRVQLQEWYIIMYTNHVHVYICVHHVHKHWTEMLIFICFCRPQDWDWIQRSNHMWHNSEVRNLKQKAQCLEKMLFLPQRRLPFSMKDNLIAHQNTLSKAKSAYYPYLKKTTSPVLALAPEQHWQVSHTCLQLQKLLH